MHWLRVFCRSKISYPVWEYSITEHDNGTLRWGPECNYNVWWHDGPVFILERAGNMATTPVLDDEVEAITGLHMPVARDRLREMVHDS